ncbi:efflux RND transporter permease subunit [Bacteroides sp. 224]|uniref:efflux RND transporter permease subunit n=1 Tax=Bacteroides sp. 224 TaxID=2302936 RepID=UPI0013D6B9B3|nr:efflux RND transporter permease subunit [Bacteroides sp. 224]NDV64514.1 ATP-binding cassette domain-containing protein [Bacteroides sp. 224]
MDFVLHRRITISMLFIALTLLGYVSYKQLPVELLPNAELPTLFVQVSSSQDMDPSYVESEVVIPLEGAISAIGGVDKIQSNIDNRQSNIRIDFKSNVNFKITSLKLEEKIAEVASTLPEGFDVRVQKVDVAQMANNFITLQVRGSGGVDRVRNVVDREVRPELENIDGVASVNIYGGRERAIEIQLDPDMCKALNLTPAGISNTLSQNTQEKAFVGYSNEPDGKFFVHVNSLYTQVSDLENIVVAPGPIHLKDIATVFFDLKEETSYSRVNGKDAISVALTNDSQANLIELSHRAVDAIDKLNEKLALYDVEIVVQENTAEVMEKNINEIINLAITGGLLAILILWLFLKNLRLVFLIALSIPISVYTAFNFFYAFGITINSLTLVGMALAVGMLLDNSVVVLENIYRLSGAGETPERSVLQGTKEVWRSIVAATLTTVTVFLPFIFSDNFLIKLIGHHIGVSIISTLLISLVVALLFVPMVTYVILKKKNGNSVFYEKISITQRPIQIYLVLLKTAMRNPGVTIFGAVIVLFVTLILSITLNVQQMKDVNSDRFNIYVTMPRGSTLENTDAIVKVMEERLEEFPEKKELICRIRESEAVLTLVLQEDYQKISKRNIADIKADVQGKLSNTGRADIYIAEASGGGGGASAAMSGLGNFMRMMGIGDNRERIVVKGSDYDMMQLVAEDIRYFVNEQEFIRGSWVSYTGRQAELRLDFDPILLTTYNITRNNISSGLSSLNNEFSSGTNLKIGDDSYDIIIRSNTPQTEEEEELLKREKNVDDLKAVQIQNAEGGLHDLSDLASINYGRGRSRIMRVNQDKQLEVFYSFSRNAESSKTLLEAYRADIDDFMATYNLPAGVAVEVFHEEDQFADFKFLIFAAFILIFMILASVFESISTPFVLLFTIPLAAIGSLLALLLTSNSLLNANTLTGFLILLGVVVNNGIILIDYSNILRKRGYRRNRSLMMAGLSRIRPILITSITTIIAMMPLAMGDSEYSGAIGAPFAITVIGGLAFSAILTLVFIPTVCMGLENTLQWYRSLSRKLWALHLVIYVVGVLAIYLYADGMLWQSIYLVALTALIPGVTYFIQTSLRRANAEVVNPDEEIRITVRNLVKIYDWPGRFSRQWKSGLNIRKRLGLSTEYHSLKDFRNTIWEFALFGFLIYFTYFFINSKLWFFLLSFVVYALTLNLWRKIRTYLYFKSAESKTVKNINRIIFWSIPPIIWFMMLMRMDNPKFVIGVGVLWAFCIAIYVTSQYLYNKEINIERVQGRFAGFKRPYFRMVKSIPLIGKQRKPFKALRGVSFEIKTGMFGLLGPNGAGKSTMMRIICGILEQSYGSIWINGLDSRIYREELQGLIGFLPQEFGTYENMSSWEFLDYQAILKGITDKKVREERIEYVLKSVHMYERKDAKIGSFSGGMKQRIGIALILLHLPRILIVDEPTAGLDPRERIRFRNLLVELSKERIVIFSTHIIEDISSSCNQVVVVNKGDLKYFGDPIDMVNMATGKVWSFTIDKTEFEKVLDKSMVIHHMQDENIIQVRYLSYEQPYEGAVQVEANLEDAYLCLLKNMN